MRALAAVGVNYYLSARQPAVALGTAYLEPARRVDVKFGVFVYQFAGYHIFGDLSFYVVAQRLSVNKRIVLRRYHHGIHALGRLAVVFHGHLCLAVGAQIGQNAALSHLCQPHGKLVRKHNGQRHQFLRLAAGIAEHHALVARARLGVLVALARLCLERFIHAQRNVGALPVHSHGYLAPVESKVAKVVAYFFDRLSGYLLVVYVCKRRHFAHYQQAVIRRAALHGASRRGVGGKYLVDYRVRNAVAQFVGVTFGHALARKKFLHVSPFAKNQPAPYRSGQNLLFIFPIGTALAPCRRQVAVWSQGRSLAHS